ncbi:restriction endonuclease subunit S [Salinibacter ruber]|uniref:restriction endonuclease subunit S n=1 Tax=Salinibacter ruber TaxID=146919 RepID=UPI00207367BB|nr:restriction endonuclease subunit S [Salinibacter ruber]
MSDDDLGLDMEIVEDDELDELGAGGASNSEERPRSWSKESKEAGTEGSDKRSEEVRKGRLSNLQGASVSPSKSEKGTELINGVLWSKVGSIPDGWEFVNLGPEVSIQTGYNAPSKNFIEEGGIPLIRNRDLGSEETEIQYDGDYGEEYLIEDGDLLVSMDGEFEPHLWTGGKALLNQRVCKIESSDRYSHIFLAYAIEKPLYLLQKSIAGTTVKHLSKSNIRSVNLPTPPLPEQRKIASVLYAVDQAIQKTEAIIEQAKRVKRGFLQDLFSFGVGSDDRLRDPDQDPGRFRETKLGSLPSDWEVIPMGKAISTLYRYPSYYDIEYVDEGVPEVRGELLRADGTINLNTEEIRYVSEETASEYPRVRLEENDFVISVRGTVGKVGRIPPSLAGGVITANLIRVKFDTDKILPDYAQIMLLSRQFQRRLDALTSATTIKTIKADDLRRIPVRLPDLSEQRRISKVVQSHREKIRKEQAQLDELLLLKKGLMQNLLTGEVRTADKAIDVLNEVVEHG